MCMFIYMYVCMYVVCMYKHACVEIYSHDIHVYVLRDMKQRGKQNWSKKTLVKHTFYLISKSQPMSIFFIIHLVEKTRGEMMIMRCMEYVILLSG